jgi:hypothetical protein
VLAGEAEQWSVQWWKWEFGEHQVKRERLKRSFNGHETNNNGYKIDAKT